MSVKHYELHDDDRNHHKFWEISICDPVVASPCYTVHYGRIGNAGQKTMKMFGSVTEATVAADKIIRSKESKGYELLWEKQHEKRSTIFVSTPEDTFDPLSDERRILSLDD